MEIIKTLKAYLLTYKFKLWHDINCDIHSLLVMACLQFSLNLKKGQATDTLFLSQTYY